MTTCPYCESKHKGACPRVKSIEYADDGKTVRRVEFHGPASVFDLMRLVGPPYQPEPQIVTPQYRGLPVPPHALWGVQETLLSQDRFERFVPRAHQ